MIQTQRLYYENVYCREFEAVVLDCRKQKDGYALLLDKSAFYPEGGGQPSDQGYIGEIEVTEVLEKDGELLHYTRQPAAVGEKFPCRICWEKRFDLMQQHSGEHMVSGLVHSLFGYDNVGFHMGSDVITIDFNGILTREQLKEIEAEVNKRIWANTPVEIFYPSGEELEQLPYRSKKELTGQVRLVRFPGTDLCACCGTHVSHTGEIGLVKLLSVEKFREGVRVEMLSGRRALQYLDETEAKNRQISMRLSAKPDKTSEAVEHLQEENFRLKGRVMQLEEKWFSQTAKEQAGKGNVLLIFQEELEPDSIRRLADAVMHTCGGRCAVFAGREETGYKYAMGEEQGDLRDFTKEMNAALLGRGGGKPFFVQGSVKAGKEEIQKFFAQ